MRRLPGFVGAAAVAAGIFVVAPLFVVVPMSFSRAKSFEFPPPGYWLGYYEKFFGSAGWLLPLANSVVIGIAVAAVTMLLVVPAAFALVRYRFAGKGLAKLVIMLPMLVPSIVMALGYYEFFGVIGLHQTYLGVILAHVCVSVPIAFLVVAASLKGFDRNLERAAASLGANRLQTFLMVTLPVLWPGFLTGGLFAFVHSFDEAVIAIFISGRDVTTLPRKMFDSILVDADPVIAVVSTLLIAVVLLGALVPALLRRRPGGRVAA
ncbi:MAG: ABC transporter permease [Alphaproteobacteria bacterium]